MANTELQTAGQLPDPVPPAPPVWERLSARDVLSVVFKYKSLIAGVFLASVLGTLLMLWLRPSSYEVEARILLKYGKDISSNPRSSLAPTANQMVSPARPDVNTEAEMIRSYALIERVVRELKLDQPAPPPVPPDFVGRLRYEFRRLSGSVGDALDEVQYRLALKERLTPKEKAIMNILNGLKVEGVKESSVIDIKLQTKYRQGSSVVLNRLVEAYREARLGIERTPEVEKFFTSEANQYGARLQQSENELSALKAKTQSASLPDRIGLETRVIAESERAATETSNKLAEANAQVSLLQQQLAGEKPTSVLEQVQGRNVLLDDLNQKKAGLLLHEQELLAKYTDDDVHVSDVRQQIATLNKMISGADQEVGKSRTTGENSVYVDLRKQLAGAVRQRDALQARFVAEQSQLAGYRGQLRELQGLEPRYNQLARSVEMNGESFKLYQRNAVEARAAENLNSEGITSIAFMDPAVDPILPSGVRRVYVFAGAVFGGLILGLGLAFIAEGLGHRLGTPDDLVRHGGFPVLATFPFAKRGGTPGADDPEASEGASSLANSAARLAAYANSTCIVFVGAGNHAGVSTVVRRFAEAFRSGMKERVLVIAVGTDGLKQTRRSSLLPAPSGVDLTRLEPLAADGRGEHPGEGYLAGRMTAEQISTHVKDIQERLPDYDRILIDLSSQITREKALSIARACSGIAVVVVEAEETRYEVLESMQRELQRMQVPLAGTVLNKRRFHIPEFVYRRV